MKKIQGSSIAKRISPERLERLKISFLFSSVMLISVLLGMLVASHISDALYSNSIFRLSTHFETVFLKSANLTEHAKIIARYAAADVISLLVIFAASFSMLNYLITDIILFYNGVKLGVTAAFLINFTKNQDFAYTVGNEQAFVFIVIELLLAALLLYYSHQAATASIRFRKTSSNGRPIIKSGDFFSFLLKTAACVGAVFILNSLYCILLCILK